MVAAGGARPAPALGGYLTTDGESQVVKVSRFGADSPLRFHHLWERLPSVEPARPAPREPAPEPQETPYSERRANSRSAHSTASSGSDES